jgi:hypothetical protein
MFTLAIADTYIEKTPDGAARIVWRNGAPRATLDAETMLIYLAGARQYGHSVYCINSRHYVVPPRRAAD